MLYRKLTFLPHSPPARLFVVTTVVPTTLLSEEMAPLFAKFLALGTEYPSPVPVLATPPSPAKVKVL